MCTYSDLNEAYADGFDFKRIGTAYARTFLDLGQMQLETWRQLRMQKSHEHHDCELEDIGCESWAMVHWDIICLRAASAELTRICDTKPVERNDRKYMQRQRIVGLGLKDRQKSIVLALGSQKKLLSYVLVEKLL